MTDFQLAREVCARFSLPEPTRVAPAIGGLQHRLLRLDFSQGEPRALKILSPRLAQTEEAIRRFERAETLALRCAQNGVPAMVALQQPEGRFVGLIENVYFLLYPWAEGEVLPPHAVSTERAALMGAFLAQIHTLKVRFPEQNAPVPEAFEDGHFEELGRRADQQNASWAGRLTEVVQDLERLNARARDAQLELQRDWVMGHLDFDQKNVLWNARDEPVILDWEQAKPISPALEALGAGLLWAGQSAGAASKSTFLAWLAGYRTRNELRLEDLELATEGVLGKWMIWLEFNFGRLLDTQLDEREREMAFGAAMHALDATLQLGKDGEIYRAWCREAF